MSDKTAPNDRDDLEDEEIGDVVPSLPRDAVAPLPKRGARSKSSSDGVWKITGPSKYAEPVPVATVKDEPQDTTEQPRRQKAMSDVALLFADPTRVEKSRTRQKSAADIIRKMNDPALLLDGADLKLGEMVEKEGTASFRSSDSADLDIPEEREHEKLADDFVLNHDGLTSDEAAELLKLYGPNALPEKVTPKWLVFLKLLIAPMPLMIWAAVIIEAGIESWLDMGILLFIQFANASIGFYETTKAADAVASLKDSLKPMATCKRNGKWEVINATYLVPGDTVLLGSGSAIPADCRINEGEIDVDQAALTGESLPVTFFKKDSCKMGSTVVRGEVEGTVEFTGSNTFLGKTAALLETNYEYSYLQKLLMRVVMILVAMTVTLCLIQFIYLLVKTRHEKDFVRTSLAFTVVVLVASIPLAIEIVTTTTLSIGSKKLVAEGAIVSQLSAIERLAGMSILCSDKTGTLTLNQMVLQDDTPMYVSGETQATVLMYAALAAKWKEPPRDALDRLTLGNVDMALMEPFDQLEYLPFDPTIKRTEGTIKDIRSGKQFKATKGAPHILLRLLPHTESAIKIREEVEKDVARLGAVGTRALAVARTNVETNEWEMVGLLTFLDPPRPDTKLTIDEARQYGVSVKMITGDHLLIAKNTSNVLGLGKRVFGSSQLPMLDPVTKKKPDNLGKDYGDLCLAADGFSEVFPEHKFLIVECLRELGYTVGMTGDGVNDAPALKRADVGIAVAGATDAARAAADIVLTQPGLHTIIHGIILAREIFARINSFISYRIAASLQLVWFFFIATFIFKPREYQPALNDLDLDPNGNPELWPEFFHMPVLMLMLITLLNDGTMITIGYDNAKASDRPCKWNLLHAFLTSASLGVIGMASSLILLCIMLNNRKPGSLWHRLDLQPINYGQITAAVYLQLSVCAFLTLFSARAGEFYFWQVRPGKILFGGALFSLSLSSILALVWPWARPDGIRVQGLGWNKDLFFFTWLFCIFFWLVQDIVKVFTVKLLRKLDIGGINASTGLSYPESTLKLMKEMDYAEANGTLNTDHHKH